MKILAIDTSCDDTAISVLKAQNKGCFELLSNVVSSQVKIHAKYGGVYPILAKREHQRNLVTVLKRALGEAGLLKIFNFQFDSEAVILNPSLSLRINSVKDLARTMRPFGECLRVTPPVSFSNPNFQTIKAILEREPELFKKILAFLQEYQKPKVDAIAVTVGPGLEPCLWQGVNFAKALGFWWKLPIIPVNHIEAHILANFLQKISEISKFQIPISNEFPNPNFQKMLPAVGLVVSGGHTQLVLMPKIGQYKIIGETRDDAAGECLDKTARILGLPYPGGPAIAVEAAKLPTTDYRLPTKLPRPMLNSKDYDFSFSGLKTAVLYDYRKRPEKVRKSKEYIRAMAKEIQQAVIDVLVVKTLKAAKEYKVKTVILGGGVAANEELREQFNYKLQTTNYQLNFLAPPKNLCTDNAAMVAITAFFHQKNKKHWKKIKVNANLRI